MVIIAKKKKTKWDFILFPCAQPPFRPGSTYPLKYNHDFHVQLKENSSQRRFSHGQRKSLFSPAIFSRSRKLFFRRAGNFQVVETGMALLRAGRVQPLDCGSALPQVQPTNSTILNTRATVQTKQTQCTLFKHFLIHRKYHISRLKAFCPHTVQI